MAGDRAQAEFVPAVLGAVIAAVVVGVVLHDITTAPLPASGDLGGPAVFSPALFAVEALLMATVVVVHRRWGPWASG